jgi:3-oxo-5-alpha-steroid 4-dehydrogenase 1
MLNTVALLIIFVSAPVACAILYFVVAPYGRHFRGGWGPSVPNWLGWMLMESPALLVIGAVVLGSGKPVSPECYLLLGLWEIHYLYRTCMFPFLIKDNGKRFPLLLIAFAFIFNSLNGYANGLFLASASPLSTGSLAFVRFSLGVALFVFGFLTHVLADRNLRHLRGPGETGYKVPRGGLFNYVSNPNYFGELVEWCGFALAAWSLPGLAFAVFTAANLVPRAHANRAWYVANFPDYPRERKRIIPFLY